MDIFDEYRKLSTCPIADALERKQIIDLQIKALWSSIPRIAGPAYTVRCAHGDNLMMHAAIHQAPMGSIVVVQSDSNDFAVAGGNVCAVAKKRGIQGFIIDGVIRDLEEIRENRFPVYARGVVPKPGGKDKPFPINGPVTVGGVDLAPGDIVVADEEGIAVIPRADAETVLSKAQKRSTKDEQTLLEDWEIAHQTKIFSILESKGIKF